STFGERHVSSPPRQTRRVPLRRLPRSSARRSSTLTTRLAASIAGSFPITTRVTGVPPAPQPLVAGATLISAVLPRASSLLGGRSARPSRSIVQPTGAAPHTTRSPSDTAL